MRRITVYESEGQWHTSSRDVAGGGVFRTMLDAAVAARPHGDTLSAVAPGYVIRLQLIVDGLLDRHLTIHSRIF